MVDTFGTGVVPDDALEDAVREVFDLQPRGIIEALSLRNPIYRSTAAYGHFGRTPERRRFVDPDVTKDVEWLDRKSTRLNSSHGYISYAVFCLKKKKKKTYARE